jgi:hypothetical protein
MDFLNGLDLSEATENHNLEAISRTDSLYAGLFIMSEVWSMKKQDAKLYAFWTPTLSSMTFVLTARR